MYSRAHLICMANVQKNRVNYPSMQIIRVYFTLRFNQQSRVISWTTMRIIQEVRISEGQIIRAMLLMGLFILSGAMLVRPHMNVSTVARLSSPTLRNVYTSACILVT